MQLHQIVVRERFIVEEVKSMLPILYNVVQYFLL